MSGSPTCAMAGPSWSASMTGDRSSRAGSSICLTALPPLLVMASAAFSACVWISSIPIRRPLGRRPNIRRLPSTILPWRNSAKSLRLAGMPSSLPIPNGGVSQRSGVLREGDPRRNDSPNNEPRQRLIVALDVSSAAAAQRIVAAVGDSALTYKVGMQLYTAEGPQVVRDLVASGRQVFLDLKYHDIPNTVGAAVSEAAKLGVSMLTVHSAGSGRMLRAAVEAAKVRPELMVLAVTVLTSMDGNDLEK